MADNRLMYTTQRLLHRMFTELDKRLQKINEKRRKEGSLGFPKAEICLLGQMSLLANKEASLILSLAQTGDMDALLKMDHAFKQELKAILKIMAFFMMKIAI